MVSQEVRLSRSERGCAVTLERVQGVGEGR